MKTPGQLMWELVFSKQFTSAGDAPPPPHYLAQAWVNKSARAQRWWEDAARQVAAAVEAQE